MLLNKTQAAFTFSCEKFFEVNPEVYFWTFTFRSVPMDDAYAMEDWHTFQARLCREFPWVWGIRVTELHRSHGIHFHFFINARIAIWHMRRLVYGRGFLAGRNRYTDFGRIQVVKCDKDPRSIAYLSNYLTKQYRIDNWFGNRRRWATFGGFEGSRCMDIEYVSDATKNRDHIFGMCQCSYTALMMVTHFSNMWGPVRRWPMEDLALVMKQPLANGSCLVKHRFANEPF